MSTAVDIVICEPLRTAVGGFGGGLSAVAPHELAATVIRAVIERTGLPPERVDDVLLGNCYPTMDAPAIGRVAALDAGLPITATGLQIDRRCGSGLQAVIYAAMQVNSGACEVVLAGGAESMSNAAFYSTSMRWGAKGAGGVMLHDSLARGRVTAGGKDYPVPGGMLETAENLRREYSIPRVEQDEFAVESHRRATAARAAGIFAEEIVPVTVPGRKGDTVVDADEHIRPDTTMETLARLKPVLGKADPDATVTAGNASGQNDGASICVVTSRTTAEDLGLRPLVRLVSWGIAGVAPKTMGIGPVPSTAKALALAGLKLSDIDLIELNEAFAAQVLACTREWGFTPADFARLNVHGSGISLGHPVGATGGRILATLTRELVRREARYGLETMCIGGGQGLAAIFERRMIEVMSPSQVARAKDTGALVAEILQTCKSRASVGTNLLDIDRWTKEMIAEAAAESCYVDYAPSFGRGPFGHYICTGVNDAVLHGLPHDYALADGDLLSLDLAVLKNGVAADSAISFIVGESKHPESVALIEATERALAAGIAAACPGARLGDVSHAIGSVLREAGYSVNTEFGGHGIGSTMHQDPHVPNAGQPGRGYKLRPGLMLALEPWVMADTDELIKDADGWTLRSATGCRTAHSEHTIAITDDGADILTLPK